MAGEDYEGVLATIALDEGITGYVIPSNEGYGTIATPFPELYYVTVPREEVEEIRRGLTAGDKERMVETMHGKIREAFRRKQ